MSEDKRERGGESPPIDPLGGESPSIDPLEGVPPETLEAPLATVAEGGSATEEMEVEQVTQAVMAGAKRAEPPGLARESRARTGSGSMPKPTA